MNSERVHHNYKSGNLNSLKDLNKCPFKQKLIKQKQLLKMHNAAPTNFHCYTLVFKFWITNGKLS